MPLPAILTSDTWILDEGLMPDLSYQRVFSSIQRDILKRRAWLYDRYNPRSLTTYRIACLLGDYTVMLHRDRVKPLPPAASQEFGIGVKSSPQTERYACFSWRNGWIPGNAYVQDTYWIMPKYKRALQLDHEWLKEEQRPNGTKVETRRRCTECEQFYDLNSTHWHKNKDGRLGWHSICKYCRNGVESQRIADKRAA